MFCRERAFETNYIFDVRLRVHEKVELNIRETIKGSLLEHSVSPSRLIDINMSCSNILQFNTIIIHKCHRTSVCVVR